MREWLADRAFVHGFRVHLITWVCIGGGLWMLGYQAWLGFNTLHTSATVLGLEQAPAGQRLNNPRTQLRLLVDGKRVDCWDSSIHWWWTHHQPGSTVPVLYYASERFPECKINSFSGRWLLGLVLLVCGYGGATILSNVFWRDHSTRALR